MQEHSDFQVHFYTQWYRFKETTKKQKQGIFITKASWLKWSY